MKDTIFFKKNPPEKAGYKTIEFKKSPITIKYTNF